MRKILILFCLVLQVTAFAQDDMLRKLTQETPDCDAINHNAFTLIPEYYAKNQADSALLAFAYWDEHCPNYYVLSLKLLLAIENDTLNALNGLVADLDFLNWYAGWHNLSSSEVRTAQFSSPYSKPNTYYTGLAARQPQKGYWQLIAKRAQIQTTRLNKGTWQYMLACFLAHNEVPLVEALEDDDSHLPMEMREAYKEENVEQRDAGKVEAALYLNYWIPQQNLAILGNHPGAGFKLGYSEHLWRVSGVLNINFVRSSAEYSVKDEDSIYTSDHFMGVLAGIELGRTLYYGNRDELGVTLGAAYHGIEALANSAPEGESSNAVYMNSYDLNAGVEYRRFYNEGAYVGLQALYHFHSFDNRLNDQLFGNSISLRLIWGFAGRSDGKAGKTNLGIR